MHGASHCVFASVYCSYPLLVPSGWHCFSRKDPAPLVISLFLTHPGHPQLLLSILDFKGDNVCSSNFLWYYFLNIFFIGRELLYSMVLVTVIHQHESATGIYMSPPSWASLPGPSPSHPSRLSRSTWLCSLCHTENFPWVPILHTVMHMFHLTH